MQASSRSRRITGLAAIHLAAAMTGWSFQQIGAPLAWMLGPMVTAAALSGLPSFAAPPLPMRWCGQTIVASAVALSLSPAALRVIAADLHVMLGLSVASISFAVLMARSAGRFGLLDPTTSLLSLLPGGPAEMATLAAQHGGRADFAALTQTFRLCLTVLSVPFLLLAIAPVATSGGGALDAPPTTSALVALALAAPTSFGLHRTGISNAFFVAPLVGVGALALSGLAQGPLPGWLVAAGQILIGVSLGAMLRPRTLMGMGRDLRLMALFSVALVLFGLVMAAALTWFGVSSLGEMMLAASAGGVAEMAIAAAGFGFDPAYVSAYHLMRIFLIVAFAEHLLRFVR